MSRESEARAVVDSERAERIRKARQFGSYTEQTPTEDRRIREAVKADDAERRRGGPVHDV